jgi:hypothetical protein
MATISCAFQVDTSTFLIAEMLACRRYREPREHLHPAFASVLQLLVSAKHRRSTSGGRKLLQVTFTIVIQSPDPLKPLTCSCLASMSSGVSYDGTEHLGMLVMRKTAKGPDCQSILQPPSRASCMAQHDRVPIGRMARLAMAV